MTKHILKMMQRSTWTMAMKRLQLRVCARFVASPLLRVHELLRVAPFQLLVPPSRHSIAVTATAHCCAPRSLTCRREPD